MFEKLERVEKLPISRFQREFIGKKPIVFTETTGNWRPEEFLTQKNLLTYAGKTIVKVRPKRDGYLAATRITQYMTLDEYNRQLTKWYLDINLGLIADDLYPPYLHDTPILKNCPHLAKHLSGFPAGYLPNWYHSCWQKFCLFFIGPSKGTTPLHFDSCETNNLFFQVSGKKKLILIPNDERLKPYRINWQWSTLNAQAPNDQEARLLQSIGTKEVILQSRDILYMPPRTWHQVSMIEPGISFNIDWHTSKSAMKSLLSLFRKSPIRNAFNYNLPLALGLTFGVPAVLLIPWIEKHLDYVD